MPADVLPLMAGNIAKVRQLATTFRAAIERTDKSTLCITFRQFPAGSCGDASFLLARFLRENGMGIWNYALGIGHDAQGSFSHAWIEQDGWIVDITADQFPIITEPVIVTRQSAFHESFERDRDVATDYRQYGQEVISEYEREYQTIMRSVVGP